VQNAGVSGDTSSGGRARIDWLLDRRFDLVIVALGANDGLRGLDPALTRANLLEIIRRVRKTGARVLLAGMRAPPNLGRDYGRAFDALFPEIARTNGIAFYPFFLDGVAGRPDLNQPDGMHPNRKGVAIIVERMLPFVMKALGKD
jgi:acyl-CoA thioesterase-1